MTKQTTQSQAAGDLVPAPTAVANRGPRSPNFPGISFSDALAKARILYDHDKRAQVAISTILTHLGFGKNLSGSSARVVSALRQFGLLEDASGQYRVSDAAYKLFVLSPESAERLKIIQSCVLRPPIYRDVLNRYKDGLPSDAALSDYLVTDKKFNVGSTDNFIRCFRASIGTAKLTQGAYTSDAPMGAKAEEFEETEKGEHVNSGTETKPDPIPQGSGSATLPPLSWVLSVPRGVRAELRIHGQPTIGDLKRLKKQIEFLEESFAEEEASDVE